MNFEIIRELIAERLEMEKEEIKLESNFKDDLGIDSLDIFEIVMDLEDKLDMQIPTEDLENMEKIQDLVKYLDERAS